MSRAVGAFGLHEWAGQVESRCGAAGVDERIPVGDPRAGRALYEALRRMRGRGPEVR